MLRAPGRRVAGHERLGLGDRFDLESGDTCDLALNVAEGNDTVVLGFLAKASGSSSLDPTILSIEDDSGTAITPISMQADVQGESDSLMLASLAPGDYTIVVGGEQSTAGAFELDVYLPGDSVATAPSTTRTCSTPRPPCSSPEASATTSPPCSSASMGSTSR